MADETKNVAPKVELTIDQVKEDLKNGVGRDQMKEKYGLKRADIIRLFKHPELKGLKVHTDAQRKPRITKAQIGFVLKDASGNDVTEEIFEPATNGTSETTANVAETAQAEDSGNAKGW